MSHCPRAMADTDDDTTELAKYANKWDAIYSGTLLKDPTAADHKGESGAAGEGGSSDSGGGKSGPDAAASWEWHSSWAAIADIVGPYLNRVHGAADARQTRQAGTRQVEQAGQVEEAAQAEKRARAAGAVVDVGCGTSELGVRLCEAHGFGRLCLFDASPVCVDKLKAVYCAGGSDDGRDGDGSAAIECVLGDCRALPQADGSVDVVVDKGTLDALDFDLDIKATITECSCKETERVCVCVCVCVCS